MCKIRLSQKALKKKIPSVFSQTLFENGRRRTGRSGGKAAEGEESGWDLENTGTFNSIQLCSPVLYQHTKLLFLPHSLCPAAFTLQGDIFTSGVCSEPPPPTMLAPGAPQWGQLGLCKGEPDHRLAILGSTHPQAPSLISLRSVIFTVSKPSSQATICPLTSPHPPETQ